MKKIILIHSIISSGFALAYQFFYWDLIKDDPFQLIATVVAIVLYGYFGLIFVLVLFMKLKAHLILHCIILLLVVYVPLSEIRLKYEFIKNNAAREDVVKMVNRGELKPYDIRGYIKLPSKYHHLSLNGEIDSRQVPNSKNKLVKFRIYATIYGESAYIYSSKQKDMDNPPPKFWNIGREYKKINENWYLWSDFNNRYWPEAW